MRTLNLQIYYPYAVLSDIHFHDWQAFSHTNEDGINNRLQHIIEAVLEAADTLEAVGGMDIIITGDVFHTRGKLKPSVLNPVIELFQHLVSRGLRVFILAGNHDLEFKNSNDLGSALAALETIEGVYVFNYTTLVGGTHLFIPWHENFGNVVHIANKKALEISNLTVLCHVGLSDVIPANMGHVVNHNEFSEDIKYVFSGHFHNHASFNSRVFSVGALTHQTWSDVGSKAGFLIVDRNGVTHHGTKAPKFVDFQLTSSMPVGPNYVRVKGILDREDVAEYLKHIKEQGALGVLDLSTRPTIKKPDKKYVIKVEDGIDNAIAVYCHNNFGEKWKEVVKICFDSMN